MRWLYSIILYLLTPWLLFRLWLKARKLPAYSERIGERFCWSLLAPVRYDVWVHAVSLGEVIAVNPLVERLLSAGYSVLITTMTPTGAAQARRFFGDRIHHRYIPYDLPWSLRRFFKMVKPKVCLIVETELWPNLIHYTVKNKIPLFLVNARLSERSYQNYKKIRWIVKSMLNQFSAILAQSADDAQRFIALGADRARVQIPGNIKFDLEDKSQDSDFYTRLKASWGERRPVFIIASTHDNEEALFLSHLKYLQKAIPELLLLIVPRHPERFDAVVRLSQESGFNTGRRSQPESIGEHNEVVVIDSLGELLAVYDIGDYAFVGGSLVPVGGHNVLEPISKGLPVLIGPQYQNFKSIVRQLQEAGAIEIGESVEDLSECLVSLSQNPEKRDRLVTKGLEVLESNKGAVGRCFDVVVKVFD